MTLLEILSWVVVGAVLGVVVAALARTEGLTWIRGLGIGAFGAIVGGLIGRILLAPGASTGEPSGLLATGAFAAIGAVVTVLIARFQLRNRERPRFS